MLSSSIWPYTYPRYYLEKGILREVPPPFLSLAGYREHFYSPEKWDTYIKWLSHNDKYYDPLLFLKTILDHSSVFQMIRRAYACSSQRKKEARVFDIGAGFKSDAEEVQLLQSLIISFAGVARREKSLPIIYIVNNVAMGDHLYRILEPTLRTQKVLYVSSHGLCPPDDPTLFEAISHFIPSKNILLAQAVMDLIKSNLKPD